MTESFISTKDRIISTAIDIISDSGLSSLTTKTISQKANLSEPLLYRFYGDINELLVDVVHYFYRFDKSVQKTVQSKDGSNVEKIRDYASDYAIYYESYESLSIIMLQYEELLHNPATREAVVEGANGRRTFVSGLFKAAAEAGEIREDIDPDSLADLFHGYMHAVCLKRRFGVVKGSFKKDMCVFIDKLLEIISVRDGGKI